MLVSVVVPIFNPGSYFARCITSLRCQSLDSTDYEIVLVDDGSTDGTSQQLDDLARQHPNVRVFHESNSGWAGRPRNIGIERARGEYVQFVDQDDELAPEALERLYRLGSRNRADVVLGKVAGTMQGPSDVFARTVGRCTVDTAKLIETLPPHKMFRRQFLVDHDIRFPEGKVRLEDQMFMVKAYLRARVVSVLGDYACYYWMRREDGGNTSSQSVKPAYYFSFLEQVLETVERETSPGLRRDRCLQRFLRVEMLSRLREPRILTDTEAEREESYRVIRELVLTHFGPPSKAIDLLPPVARLRTHLIHVDRLDSLVALARRQHGDVVVTTEVLDVSTRRGRLHVELTAQLQHRDETPLLIVRRAGRFRLDPRFTDGIDGLPQDGWDVGDPLKHAEVTFTVDDPSAQTGWYPPVKQRAALRKLGPNQFTVVLRASTIIDPRRLGGGLPSGRYDVRVRVQCLGFGPSNHPTTHTGPLSVNVDERGWAAKGWVSPLGTDSSADPCRRDGLGPMVKVSVVVPVYNPGAYIEPLVKSLDRQSLPSDEFEVIFVDDGSTDETPGYLDQVAGERPWAHVFHQENSGWPGQPRNVGIEAARGEYIFFSDNDDWLGDEALERMYDYANTNSADIVVGKMAGLNRAVPQNLFRRSRPAATLTNAPLMDSLTPHKLFRRAFINQHNIRFPEGRRRLEDHVFVVEAYLLAAKISVYSDYTCYYHIARKDASNAGFRAVDWHRYFANLSEALDLVVAHTNPGDRRDTIYRRWLQNEMVNRLTGQHFLLLDPDEADLLFAAAHATAARYFGEGVVRRLPLASQGVARALLAGDRAAATRLAEAESHWELDAKLLQMGWDDRRLQISGFAAFVDVSHPAGSAITASELFVGLSEADRATALSKTSVSLDVTERRSGQRWAVPCSVHQYGTAVTFIADVDPDLAAAGHPLGEGIWDFHLESTLLGVRRRRRLVLIDERAPAEPQLRSSELGSETAAYLTKNNHGLTLDVGLLYHPGLRSPVEPEEATVTGAEDAAEPSGEPPAASPGRNRFTKRAVAAVDRGVDRLRGRQRR